MRRGAALNIRMDAEMDAELDRVASELGTSKSALIRLLARTFVDHLKKTGSLGVPVDWKALLKSSDKRSGHITVINGHGNKVMQGSEARKTFLLSEKPHGPGSSPKKSANAPVSYRKKKKRKK